MSASAETKKPLFWPLRLGAPAWWRSALTGRLGSSVHDAEIAGIVLAFRVRTLILAILAVWLLFSVAWPRDIYYLTIVALFFVLSYVPYRLRYHRFAKLIKAIFIALDVALVTAAILTPPLGGLAADWPVQTRLRGQEYLYLLLLLAEAVLTYSPLLVIWTGLAISGIWSFGVMIVYWLPGTTRFSDVTAGSGSLSDGDALRLVFDPTFVSLTQWWTQLIVTALLTLIIALAVWRSRATLIGQVRAEVTRSDLARYVSPDVAEAMASKADLGFGEPTRRNVAVMFADIIGFTGLSERLSAEQIFDLLRSFQTRSCRIVFEHGGTLDKFLGDGFMATFGGLEHQADAAQRALSCALALQEEMKKWNAKRRHRAASEIKVAIGLHYGEVVVGNLGADRRIEFTVVGDVVNVASRLEAATRELGVRILVSDACLAAAGLSAAGEFDRVLNISLRGKSSTIRAHAKGTEEFAPLIDHRSGDPGLLKGESRPTA
ncbi:adenylate/guanylate cyclase domain-containing protein [Rhodoligotrophos ferricapiens]|uniref:adenylate/guanylate cyclase domain-containing protein n=1 Tax=Rhodoligotrophos ferricapiens TaxID=3069264 RepID=UPI00315C6C56